MNKLSSINFRDYIENSESKNSDSDSECKNSDSENLDSDSNFGYDSDNSSEIINRNCLKYKSSDVPVKSESSQYKPVYKNTITSKKMCTTLNNTNLSKNCDISNSTNNSESLNSNSYYNSCNKCSPSGCTYKNASKNHLNMFNNTIVTKLEDKKITKTSSPLPFIECRNNNSNELLKLKIYKIELQLKLNELELIAETFKKICNISDYYIKSLNETRDIILNSDDDAINLLMNTTKNLYNMIFLEIKKNKYNLKKTDFISIEKTDLFYIPQIHLDFSNNILIITIKEDEIIYKYIIGDKYILSSDLDISIDDSIDTCAEIYQYFNSRYTKVSSIINYIKIHILN